MSILSMNDLAAAFERRQLLRIQKASEVAEGAGTFHSLWKTAGYPASGATPPSGNGEVPTRTTTGALRFVNPGGTRQLYVGGLRIQGATIAGFTLYDRLWHNSGFVGNVATLQSIGSPPVLPARAPANGVGVELWAEFYTAIGATGATLTALYTNQLGTSGRSATYAHPANAESVGQMVRFNLDSGDSGVRTVASVQWSISTGTAGDFGLVLLAPIAEVDVTVVNQGQSSDVFQGGMGKVGIDACLALQVLCSTTNTGLVISSLTLIEN
jgi:hypothetical protein